MSIRTVITGTWMVFFASLVAACGGGSGGDHSIGTAKYDKTCVGDSDCVAVYQGELGCCGGGCPNAAIAATGYAQYLQDVAANQPVCNPAPPCAATPGACQTVTALCVGSLCTAASTSGSAISASASF